MKDWNNLIADVDKILPSGLHNTAGREGHKIEFIGTRGVALREAVVRAASVRAQPIVLTGLAAMIGALFILDDPIFNGLAISLVFGLFASTVLTLVVIPVLYYLYLRNKP